MAVIKSVPFLPRLAELVSASMSQLRLFAGEAGWTLKRVQGDDEGALGD